MFQLILTGSGMGLFYTIRNKASAKDVNGQKREKMIAILEIVVLVFLTTFIPALIKLGRPPANLAEIWVELLVALLACLYAYARIRNIDLGGTE